MKSNVAALKVNVLLGAILLIFAGCSSPETEAETETEISASPYELVSTFIGTGGHGHTFPGATVPFGMVQLSPDTRLEGWDGCSGYHYSDDTVYGFSHTHLSGTGVGDYADILFLPDNRGIQPYQTAIKPGNSHPFNHENETAHPGYYRVEMGAQQKYVAELTVTERCGFHKYDYLDQPKDASFKGLILNTKHRDKTLDAGLQILSPTQIAGHRISEAWAEEQHVYFYAEFSQPLLMLEYQSDSSTQKFLFKDGQLEDQQGNAVNFPLTYQDLGSVSQFQFAGEETPLLVKVGISPVSVEGAKNNLKQEIPHWDFEQTRQEAKDKWTKALAKVTVEGGTEAQQRTFYSALYHTMVAPNLYSDVDNRYRGMDMKIRRSEADHYTVFSLWDTYRATHPLYTIIEQERTNDFINALLNDYRDGGRLPIWALASNYTNCMIGYHAIPVIADAYEKGIRGYDVDYAMEAMLNSAELDHFGLESYKQFGYIPSDKESESVSKTLEYSYDDWCIARMAESAGKADIAENFYNRSLYYRSLYDPATKFMRARRNGAFVEPFDPAEVNFHFTEANSWQYSLYAPHDVEGLTALIGGPEALEKWLDELFTASEETTGRHQADITGLIGQYAHGNEPSHHMAYLYNYVGKPAKTQQRVRQILTELYTDQPDGLSGNEDCGQMSAWYVLSAAGFYPVTPGDTMYAIGSPLFESTTFSLENGNSFTIKAEGVADKPYIASASLNGQPLNQPFFSHQQLMMGGELLFEMTDDPNTGWGSEATYNTSVAQRQLSAPYINKGKRVFADKQTIEMSHPDPAAKIYYELDGAAAQPYEGSIEIDSDCNFRFYAQMEGLENSEMIEASFSKYIPGRGIVLESTYAPQYAAGGDQALIDRLKGTPDFRTGLWQGYEGVDMVAVVDLGKVENVESVATGFLQDENSWIFMPALVQYQLSTDGETWSEPRELTSDVTPRDKGAIMKDYGIELNGAEQKVRFIRVTAKTLGTCPKWHKGAGGKCWIFADEIKITTQS